MGPKSMIRLFFVFISAVLLVTTSCTRSPPTIRTPPIAEAGSAKRALELRSNVVAIEAQWRDGRTSEGFGFVTGQRGGTAYIATALHILRGDQPDQEVEKISVRLFDLPGQSLNAEMLEVSNSSIDLGVISFEWPEDVAWNPGALASVEKNPLAFGIEVSFVGRKRDWYVPMSPGAVNEVLDDNIRVDNLNISVGSSGAILVSDDGVIGMILRDVADSGGAVAMPIWTIKSSFEKWRLPWQLIPSPLPPQMAVIPAGCFEMGSPKSEIGRDDDEGPVHQVCLRSFAIGRHEVTFAEWDACVADGGCSYSPDDEKWGRGNRPVINVSWHDAQQYVAWLRESTGKDYRLPSEAEWEYAARAGIATTYSTGTSISSVEDANFNGRISWNRTTPVGKFPPNAFGLFDVHGNVWEWVEDLWHPSYNEAPSNGSPWIQDSDFSSRVRRGGSWSDGYETLRFANRHKSLPKTREPTIGFRVASSSNE